MLFTADTEVLGSYIDVTVTVDGVAHCITGYIDTAVMTSIAVTVDGEDLPADEAVDFAEAHAADISLAVDEMAEVVELRSLGWL